MEIPFTTEQFFSVFEEYNSTVFPFQWIIILLGMFALFLIHSKHSSKNKLIGSFLGLLWVWIGIVYHIIFFTAINKLAFVFGGFFILQGVLILINTFLKDRLIFSFSSHTKNYFGYFFIIFGFIVYPIISYFVHGSFNRTIALGLPCPSTIFTFGLFMMASNKFPKYLLIIPSLWAVVGLGAAIQFGVYQDFVMPITAIITGTLLFKTKK
ncbi:DUF6064 family protein [Ulvibacter antarcticus]|uniref:Uncharacterized protein n=1 Tax=Ulvibacter antarcticus TaxID=442714 RepID=A0A3L9YGS5_9FLAO|nr:DUF6064 family protein [Ulvibacter antarcticus]RMA58757.1 hypothetical protein BXY75_2134 [Ulvibacter antarcticus]